MRRSVLSGVSLAAWLGGYAYVCFADALADPAVALRPSALLLRSFLAVLLGCCALSVYLSRRRYVYRAVVCVQTAFCLLFLASRPSNVLSELVFACNIVTQLSLYEPYPANLAAGLGVSAAASILIGAGNPAVGVVIGRWAFLVAALPPFFLLSAVAGLGSLMNRYREAAIEHEQRAAGLQRNVVELTQALLSTQDYAKDAEESSTTRERLRLTRDIHDAVGYTLTNTYMMLEAVKYMALEEPENIGEYVERIQAGTEDGLNQIRAILRKIRNEERADPGGIAAMDKMIRIFSISTGTGVRLELGNVAWERIAEHRYLIYNFLQEAFINAFKHGQATHIDVHFWDHGSEATVSVSDNGSGTGEIREGIGIAGMRERLERVNGTLAMMNAPLGFRIAMTIPLPRKGA